MRSVMGTGSPASPQTCRFHVHAESILRALGSFTLLLFAAGSCIAAEWKAAAVLNRGVTAHRGASAECPENTLPAFQRGIDAGADWIELDIFRTRDGRLVVIHDRTTERVGLVNLSVPDSTYGQLLAVDVAADFRRRSGQTMAECPAQRLPMLEEVLRLVMQQSRTRVSIQPKMDCVADAVAMVKRLQAERWVGFNDGNLQYLAEVKRLAPEIPVFWDRGPDANLEDDLRIAQEHRFESLVLHHSGVTAEKVQQVKAAGLEIGAWTVNDPAEMGRLLDLGVERLYTDDPERLLALKADRHFANVTCEGIYKHHLQGVCVDDTALFWSFTTTLVKTDLSGKLLKSIPVANHHGDLCCQDGRLYVAVNLGKFNDPQGNADSWVYVYDAATLQEVARHPVPEAIYGAGGIGYREGRYFVVGGLPAGIDENYVYEYDDAFRFVKRYVIPSGPTQLGIQTVTFAHDRWWFGCYGTPKTLLLTNADFQLQGRYEFDCSLGIEALPGGRLLAAIGGRIPNQGCTGKLRVVQPDDRTGLRYSVDGK